MLIKYGHYHCNVAPNCHNTDDIIPALCHDNVALSVMITDPNVQCLHSVGNT